MPGAPHAENVEDVIAANTDRSDPLAQGQQPLAHLLKRRTIESVSSSMVGMKAWLVANMIDSQWATLPASTLGSTKPSTA
jgi:hypothetical protein